MASLKELFIADLGISETLSFENRCLSAITIASSSGTLMYKLFSSRHYINSSSSKMVAIKAAPASFDLVSIFAPVNLWKNGDNVLSKFSLLLPGIEVTARSGELFLCFFIQATFSGRQY